MSDWKKLFQFKRLIAMTLTVALCVPTVPATIYAAEANEIMENSVVTEEKETADVTEVMKEAEVTAKEGETTDTSEAAKENEATEKEEEAAETSDVAEEVEVTEKVEENTEMAVPDRENVGARETADKTEMSEELNVQDEFQGQEIESSQTDEIESASLELVGISGTVHGANYTLNFITYGDATSNYAKITGFTAAEAATDCRVVIPSFIDVEGTAIPVTEIAENAFKGKKTITQLLHEENPQLTTIGSNAFNKCTSLTYIDFPESLIKIDKNAFEGATALGFTDKDGNEAEVKELILPAGLKTLATKAFKDCDTLEKVTIPMGLETVSTTSSSEAGPFHTCDNLETIVIPDGMTAIPTNLFNGDIVVAGKELVFQIPASVTNIKAGAFKNCNMQKVFFDTASELEIIEANAFEGCDKLYYMEFPENLKTIGIKAFSGAILLGSKDENGNDVSEPQLVLPEDIKDLGSKAFEGCTSFTSVLVPKHIDKVTTNSGNLAGPFYLCSNVKEVIMQEGMIKIANNLFRGRIISTEKDELGAYLHTMEFTIPDSVVIIEEQAFYDQVNMTGVKFGENPSLKTIGDGAFYNTLIMESFDLPDTVEELGADSFSFNYDSFETNALREFNISNNSSLKVIGDRSFNRCFQLKYINLIEGIERIGDRAFGYIGDIFTVDKNGETVERPVLRLPSTLTTLGWRAFAGNPALKEVYIPKSLTTYEYDGPESSGAFWVCTGLEKIEFEEGIEAIPRNLLAGTEGEVAVEGCSYIDIVIPASVKSISTKLFIRNPYIRSVKFAEGTKLTTIESYAFAKCANMETIEFPQTLKTIGDNAFEKASGLKNILIPVGTTTIGDSAFAGCSGLEKVEFEVNNLYSTTQTLDDDVFKNCTSLKVVEFGNKIKKIPNRAFSGCIGLEELVFPYGITEIGSEVFFNCESLRNLFIPSSVTTIKTKSSELAYCYEQGLKIYVEKGDSAAKTFATKNGWETEVGIYVTEDEFPDPNLLVQMRKQLYDKNLDTRLTLRELEQIVDVNLRGLGIKDMTGTQLFTSVETLDCSKNEIVELNTETWTRLKSLNCSDNRIEDLDLSQNPIETLDCSQNCILVFDFSEVDTLTNVTLGVQNGHLAVEENTLYDFFALPLPEKYSAYDNNNVSQVSDEDAQKPGKYGITWLERYDVPDQVQYNYTTAYGKDDMTAEAVVWVSIPNAGIEISHKEYPDLNLRNKINELVDTNNNGLISKNEERNCSVLDVTGTEESKISDLTGIARLVNLKELICKNNALEALDVSNNKKLEKLDCSNNKIKELNVNENDKLVDLNCSNNKVKELILSENSNLESLTCADNKIAKLDLSKNPKLELIECGNNSLAALSVSQNAMLTDVLSGKHNITFVREVEEDKVVVNVRDYDEAFNHSYVSNLVAYIGEDADTSGEYLQLTENGFTTTPMVTKITYKYAVPGHGSLNVTLNLADELEEEKEILLKNIAELEIDAFVSKIYTGEETCQNIVIYDDNYMLREDVDYKVTYRNNIQAGTAKVVIEGLGKYKGSYENTYKIVNEWNVSVKEIKDQTFQNKKIEPQLTVKDGRKTLRKGTDYTVEYLNNKNTGVATVVITGCGNYADAGMKELTFNIVECKISKASFKAESVTYNGKAQTPEITAVYNNAYLKEGKDFKVVYSKNVNAGKGTMTITGLGNYIGTVKKTFTIQKLDLGKLAETDVVVEPTAKFNMLGAKAKVSITYGDYPLAEGVDYTLSYSKNKAVGTGKVTIKGKGSCNNKVVKEFEITAQNIDDPSVKIDVAIAQVDKNGKAVKPKVTVTQNNKKLREGENKDYVVVYDETDTTKKGSCVITVYGKNNYGGSEEGVEKEFILVEQLIGKAKVKGIQNLEYDGSEKEQVEETLDVMIGKTEVPANCYEVTYSDNVNIGDALITVIAKPENCDYEFGGAVTAKFKILPVKFKPSKTEERVTAEFMNVDYKEEIPVVTYGGSPLTPEVVVYDEVLGVNLVEGIDYVVTYKNNVNVGNKGSVTVMGIKNYSGSINLNFSVVPKDMGENGEDFKVQVKNSAYTGKKIQPRILVWDKDVVLKQGKDYVLCIEPAKEVADFDGNIKEKGKYIITIQGKGNYTSELEEQYYLSVY